MVFLNNNDWPNMNEIDKLVVIKERKQVHPQFWFPKPCLCQSATMRIDQASFEIKIRILFFSDIFCYYPDTTLATIFICHLSIRLFFRTEYKPSNNKKIRFFSQTFYKPCLWRSVTMRVILLPKIYTLTIRVYLFAM